MRLNQISDIDLAALQTMLVCAFPFACQLGFGELFPRAAKHVSDEILARRSGARFDLAIFDERQLLSITQADSFFALVESCSDELEALGFKDAAAALRDHARGDVTIVPPARAGVLHGLELRDRELH